MTTTYKYIENLVRDRITFCAKSNDWQHHYWHMTLENGGGDFDDYGIMDDYESAMELVVEAIIETHTDWSRNGFTYTSEREYPFDCGITARVNLFEGNDGSLSRAHITLFYDEQESESDLTELRVDWIDMNEVAATITAAIRERKLAELGL